MAQKLTNPGAPLQTVIEKRGTDGGQITRVEQAVDDREVKAAAFDYGVNEVGLEQKHLNERKSVLELQEHPWRQGYRFDELGRKRIILKKTVPADYTYPGAKGILAVGLEPTDYKHSELTAELDASAIGGAAAQGVQLKAQWDNVLQCYVYPVQYSVPLTQAPPAIGAGFSITVAGGGTITGIIINGEDGPASNDQEKVQTAYIVPTVIAPWSEWDDRGFAFPGQFDIIPDGPFGVTQQSELLRPGVVYNQVAPRAGTHTCKLLHLFTHGRPTQSSLPATYMVDSPGIASNVFRIGPNYVHEGFTVSDKNGMLEIIPPSTPAFYRKGETVVVAVDCKKYEGWVYHTRIWYGNELGFPDDVDNLVPMIEVFKLKKSAQGGFTQIPGQTRLTIYGVATDTVTVYGRNAGNQQSETVGPETPWKWPMATLNQYSVLDMLLLHSANVGGITVYSGGRASQYTMDFTGNFLNGDLFKMTTSSTVTYKFVTTLSVTPTLWEVKIGPTGMPETLTNLAAAINGTAGAGTLYSANIPIPNRICTVVQKMLAPYLGKRFLITDEVKYDRIISFTVTSAVSLNVNQDVPGLTGSKVAQCGSYSGDLKLYNDTDLKNLDFKINVPPLITDSPSTAVMAAPATTSWKLFYSMQSGVTLKYQWWNSGTGAWVAGGATLTPAYGLDSEATVAIPETTTQIRLLLSNSLSAASRINVRATHDIAI